MLRTTGESSQTKPIHIRPSTDFIRNEADAGLVLVGAAIAAVVWANSPWSATYFDLWNYEFGLGVRDWNLTLNLRGWINEVAMVLFFLVVGLEIKRELTQGELRDPRVAALPVIAAFGGMIVPACVYAIATAGDIGSRGWAIPMATDIAIVSGVIALIGTRAPSWMKFFLLALAIADDIGAIVIIAIFYSRDISIVWLVAAVAAVAIAASIRTRVSTVGAYILLGSICWLALHNAHVNPTLAGVAFGLLAPVTPQRESGLIDADDLTRDSGDESALSGTSTTSVVEWLQHKLHPTSAFLIVPAFALANAGVHIPVGDLGASFSSRVTWGVIAGLVIGKAVGITGATLLAVAFKVGKLPTNVTPRYVLGAGVLGGIGFTVSLFVTELSFEHDQLAANHARLGVLVGSLAAALIGCAIVVPGRVGRVRVDRLFVYGTLRPGDVRWPILERFVVDDGVADTIAGDLYDAGLDFPAAIFGGCNTIIGRTYLLSAEMLDEALAVLDAEESSAAGMYRRVEVSTGLGTTAWAYEYGTGLTLTPIASGDWFTR